MIVGVFDNFPTFRVVFGKLLRVIPFIIAHVVIVPVAVFAMEYLVCFLRSEVCPRHHFADFDFLVVLVLCVHSDNDINIFHAVWELQDFKFFACLANPDPSVRTDFVAIVAAAGFELVFAFFHKKIPPFT